MLVGRQKLVIAVGMILVVVSAVFADDMDYTWEKWAFPARKTFISIRNINASSIFTKEPVPGAATIERVEFISGGAGQPYPVGNLILQTT